MMKKTGTILNMVILCVLLTVMLTGCRMRIISDPLLADVLLEKEEQEIPEEVPEMEPLRGEEIQEPEDPEEEEQEDPPEESAEIKKEEPSRPVASAPVAKPGNSGQRSNQGNRGAAEKPSTGIVVTFDANGGEPATVTKTVKYQEPYGNAPEVERRGHVFLGWWTTPTGGTEIKAETLVNRQDSHSVYAHWRSKRTCTVTLDPVNGRISNKDRKLEISDGDHYGTLPIAYREGYDLLGWFTEQTDGDQISPDSVFSGEEDLTLYAHWEYNPEKYWTYMLQCAQDEVYACQRKTAYYEEGQDHITAPRSTILSGSGLENVAIEREDPNTTDDWVEAKFPDYVIKCVGKGKAEAKDSIQQRFPKATAIIIDEQVLSDNISALFVKLTLIKEIYPTLVRDIDLPKAREELGISADLILF